MSANAPTRLAPIRWPAEAVWEAVAPLLRGFTVEVLPEVDSTNSELMRRFKGTERIGPQTEPTLLVAEQQSAGRGRLGRTWASQRGSSLMFSLGLLLAPVDWSGLSLAVGVSLADSLEPLHERAEGGGSSLKTPPHIQLKWPNDLWLTTPDGPLKLGGVLVETAAGADGQRFVVIGVGINIHPPVLTGEIATAAAVPPGGLHSLRPDLDTAATLLCVVPLLVRAVLAFEQFGFAPFQLRFARRDGLAGRGVFLSNGTQGTALGVSEHGALRVATASGVVNVTSAEVSVRPFPVGAA
ncbi:MAG: biotin--[acetyl-CoA-carboxylase] ligase [Polaromonas sp.]|nr:biotin--[acetyl-CoA-carboxylase] ligase [Polaromonas sp.]